MSPDSPLAVLLGFDGVVYCSDLPVLAFARHVAEDLDPAPATALIDGLRGFLEGRTLGHSTVDLTGAPDGVRAVELLAAAAGVSPSALALAFRASRRDLAASAFAVDPVPGLTELLAAIRPRARVVVVTGAGSDGVAEVLAGVGLTDQVDEVITDATPTKMAATVDSLLSRLGGVDPANRLLGVGADWAIELAAAAAAGARTALVDRFGRFPGGGGSPTWWARDLPTLIPLLTDWAESR